MAHAVKHERNFMRKFTALSNLGLKFNWVLECYCQSHLAR